MMNTAFNSDWLLGEDSRGAGGIGGLAMGVYPPSPLRSAAPLSPPHAHPSRASLPLSPHLQHHLNSPISFVSPSRYGDARMSSGEDEQKQLFGGNSVPSAPSPLAPSRSRQVSSSSYLGNPDFDKKGLRETGAFGIGAGQPTRPAGGEAYSPSNRRMSNRELSDTSSPLPLSSPTKERNRALGRHASDEASRSPRQSGDNPAYRSSPARSSVASSRSPHSQHMPLGYGETVQADTTQSAGRSDGGASSFGPGTPVSDGTYNQFIHSLQRPNRSPRRVGSTGKHAPKPGPTNSPALSLPSSFDPLLDADDDEYVPPSTPSAEIDISAVRSPSPEAAVLEEEDVSWLLKQAEIPGLLDLGPRRTTKTTTQKRRRENVHGPQGSIKRPRTMGISPRRAAGITSMNEPMDESSASRSSKLMEHVGLDSHRTPQRSGDVSWRLQLFTDQPSLEDDSSDEEYRPPEESEQKGRASATRAALAFGSEVHSLAGSSPRPRYEAQDGNEEDFEIDEAQFQAISAKEIRELLAEAAAPLSISNLPEGYHLSGTDPFEDWWQEQLAQDRSMVSGTNGETAAKESVTLESSGNSQEHPESHLRAPGEMRKTRGIRQPRSKSSSNSGAANASSNVRPIANDRMEDESSLNIGDLFRTSMGNESNENIEAASLQNGKVRGRPRGIKNGMGASERVFRYRTQKLKALTSASTADLLMSATGIRPIRPPSTGEDPSTSQSRRRNVLVALVESIRHYSPAAASMMSRAAASTGDDEIVNLAAKVPRNSIAILPLERAEAASQAAGGVAWAMAQLFRLSPGAAQAFAACAVDAARSAALSVAWDTAKAAVLGCLEAEVNRSELGGAMSQPPSLLDPGLLSSMRWSKTVLPLLLSSQKSIGLDDRISRHSLLEGNHFAGRSLSLSPQLLAWAALASREYTESNQNAHDTQRLSHTTRLQVDLARLAPLLSLLAPIDAAVSQMMLEDWNPKAADFGLPAHDLIDSRVPVAAIIVPPVSIRWGLQRIKMNADYMTSLERVSIATGQSDVASIEELDEEGEFIDLEADASAVNRPRRVATKPLGAAAFFSTSFLVSPFRLIMDAGGPTLASESHELSAESLLRLVHPRPTGPCASRTCPASLQEMALNKMPELSEAHPLPRFFGAMPVAPAHYVYFHAKQLGRLRTLVQRYSSLVAENVVLLNQRRMQTPTASGNIPFAKLQAAACNAALEGKPVSAVRESLEHVLETVNEDDPSKSVLPPSTLAVYRNLRLCMDLLALNYASTNTGTEGQSNEMEIPHALLRSAAIPTYPSSLVVQDRDVRESSLVVTRASNSAMHRGVKTFGHWFLLPSVRLSHRVSSIFALTLQNMDLWQKLAGVLCALDLAHEQSPLEDARCSFLISSITNKDDTSSDAELIDLEADCAPARAGMHEDTQVITTRLLEWIHDKRSTGETLPGSATIAEQESSEGDEDERYASDMMLQLKTSSSVGEADAVLQEEEPSSGKRAERLVQLFKGKAVSEDPEPRASEQKDYHLLLDHLLASSLRHYGYKPARGDRTFADSLAVISTRTHPHLTTSVLANRINRCLIQRHRRRLSELVSTGFTQFDIAAASLPPGMAICAAANDWDAGRLLLTDAELELLVGAAELYSEDEMAFISAALLPHFGPAVLRHALARKKAGDAERYQAAAARTDEEIAHGNGTIVNEAFQPERIDSET